MKLLKRFPVFALCLLMSTGTGLASVALFLEEPYGNFGGMIPTGHAAIYLSNVCADTLTSLRRCTAGESGVVISRYHRIAGYDWIAIPLIPYLYAVKQAGQVPGEVGTQDVVKLRDQYRRDQLESVAPDGSDGSTPPGDWAQLVGAAYDRTIYAFEIQSTEEQDNQFISAFNLRPNDNHFNLIFHNCADFARQVINFYYPKAIRRSLSIDVGIMTPKQAAKCLVRYSKGHPDLRFSAFVIGQVPGTVPRSSAVRNVVESLIKSKRYIVPLTPVLLLHPYLGGELIYTWLEERRFNPRRIAEDVGRKPDAIVQELQANRVPLRAVETSEHPALPPTGTDYAADLGPLTKQDRGGISATNAH